MIPAKAAVEHLERRDGLGLHRCCWNQQQITVLGDNQHDVINKQQLTITVSS